MTNSFRLQRCIPTPLLLIQAADKQVHVMVLFPNLGILGLTALGTLALMDRCDHFRCT
jgi:hypothetical protein